MDKEQLVPPAMAGMAEAGLDSAACVMVVDLVEMVVDLVEMVVDLVSPSSCYPPAVSD